MRIIQPMHAHPFMHGLDDSHEIQIDVKMITIDDNDNDDVPAFSINCHQPVRSSFSRLFLYSSLNM